MVRFPYAFWTDRYSYFLISNLQYYYTGVVPALTMSLPCLFCLCCFCLWHVVFVWTLCYCFEVYLRSFSDPSKFDVPGSSTDVLQTNRGSGRIQLLWVMKGDRHDCGLHREGLGPSIQGPHLSLKHDPSYSTVDVSKILMQAYLNKKTCWYTRKK